MTLRANLLMKQNVRALLRVRGATQKDLADWCRKGESWLSKILDEKPENKREFPMKYFDRIADFLGVQTYQLFQPGISGLSERRKGSDRRIGAERRIRSSRLPTSTREALMALLSQLADEDVADFARMAGDRLRGLHTPLGGGRAPVGLGSGDETRKASERATEKPKTTGRRGGAAPRRTSDG